ncbi:hypothetical protein [Streptomyces europaeiscabiei]|uniref:hypothetical protein n=1 Tax=Streptomyces europaeiscabiei TaxID=146819 RepID=UPI0038F6E8A9
MAPLARRLRFLDVSRAVLATTGVLGVLPVHAARIPVEASARQARLLGVAEPHPCDPPLPWAGPGSLWPPPAGRQ